MVCNISSGVFIHVSFCIFDVKYFLYKISEFISRISPYVRFEGIFFVHLLRGVVLLVSFL